MLSSLLPSRFFKPHRLWAIGTMALGLVTASCGTIDNDKHTSAQPTWSLSGDQVADEFLNECKARYDQVSDQVLAFSNPRITFDDIQALEALNQIYILIDKQLNAAGLYANVHPNEAVRTNADQCERHWVGLLTDIGLSQPIYKRLKEIDTSILPELEQRLVQKNIEDFERSGVDKSAKVRQRIRELNDEIAHIGQTFDKNIREGGKTFIVPSAEGLKGLPEDYIKAHPPKDDGTIALTTAYPDYVPFMQYAENDELRRQFYILYRQQAHPHNKEVLEQLIKKRHELARLLGYKNYAHYVTADKMIESPDKAQAFIDQVSAIADIKSQQEYQELLARLQQDDPSATNVHDWQKLYLEQKLKQEKYSLDAKAVRQYFHYDKVQQGIFELTEKMFDVKIRPWRTSVWHDEVSAYELLDGGKVIGRFYLDMHPRDGKYKHAAAFSIINGIDGLQTPEAALVCNFPGGKNNSGIMEHSDVETFLHEFGHLLHILFAGNNQRWMQFSGIKTEWDFVEAPSQMLEEWVWDKPTLATFAKNSKGELIPNALVDQMIKARDFGKGMWTKHQLFYAALSLGVYNQDPSSLDIDKLLQLTQAKYSPFGYVDDTYFYTSFGHLNGYSAIYYTYMWSLVMAADMHSEFAKTGLLNKDTAKRYRELVLAPGGKKDAAQLVRDFLGRDYSFDAFAKDLTTSH